MSGQESRQAPVFPAPGREPDDGEGEAIGWAEVTDWLNRHQVFLIGLGLILIELICPLRVLRGGLPALY